MDIDFESSKMFTHECNEVINKSSKFTNTSYIPPSKYIYIVIYHSIVTLITDFF